MNMQEHLKLLGYRVRSRVVGFEGVVTSISFDVNGCIQAAVNPGVDKDGKWRDSVWCDTKNLLVLSDAPVCNQPDFAIVPGGHPLPSKRTA